MKITHQTQHLFSNFRFHFCISELYEFCLKEGIADKNLIAKWKKQGYENLCCLRCIQTRDTNHGTNCVCRVPKSKLEEVCSIPFLHPYLLLSLLLLTPIWPFWTLKLQLRIMVKIVIFFKISLEHVVKVTCNALHFSFLLASHFFPSTIHSYSYGVHSCTHQDPHAQPLEDDYQPASYYMYINPCCSFSRAR